MKRVQSAVQLILCFLSFLFPSLCDESFKAALSSAKNIPQDVLQFYDEVDHEPLWFFQGSLTKCGHIALDVLKNAAVDGLNPSDYEDAFQATNHPENWVDAEILLTKRFLEYIDHVRAGRLDPKRISNDIKFSAPKVHPVELLLEATQDKEEKCAKLCRLSPSLTPYVKLKSILSRYRKLAKKTKEWPTLETLKPLKIGDTNPAVETLREILILYGDLNKDEENSLKFDKKLDMALRQFQKRYTIEQDGILGGKTKDSLNQSIDDLIRKIIFNMERLRWLPEDLGEKFILVNVAGYQVQAYENSDVQLTIPAIVGRPSRRTPLFYAPVKNIIVNPSWGVPYNILVHDKIPKIINDPDYVRRSGFTVTDDSGMVIDPDEADWENEGSHYHLRQSPGPHNALGFLKITIENPYTIYLHGTPEEKLFLKTARALSSGCIRLKAPLKLAAWILNDEDQWSEDAIQEAIKKGRTQTLQPDTQISVYFTYQTVWVGEDGLVYVSDDPYRMDKKMEKVLNSKL